MSEDAKKYQIMELVATGGTAVLYRAVQTSLDRVVAVKKLHHHLTTDENFTRRFILEAKAAASLDHENIVKIIDFGVEDGTYMMVMEFIEGESLREVLDKWKQLPANLAFALVHQVCMGLEHAHAKGIVHRDIKPGNIMVTRAGRAKITDFGLAKLAQSQVQQTAANSILGTPLYMSPEQAFGESVDQRSDLFSLGTVLYECLTGHQPFNGESYMGVIQNIIHQNAPHPSKYGIELPPASEGIVLKAMHKNRENRFQSAREFRLAIEKFLGLDALREANDNMKSLLATDGATVVLPKTERVRVRKRRATKSIVVAISVISVAAFAAVGYFAAPQALRERIAGFAALSSGPNAAVEESAPADTPVHRDIAAAGVETGLQTIGLIDSGSAGAAGAAAPSSADSQATPPDDSTAAAEEAELAGDSPPLQTRVEKAVETPIGRPLEAAAKTPVAEKPAGNAQKNSGGTLAETPTETPEERAAEPAKKGWLSVTTEPAAEVYIDGEYRGDTPLPRLEIRSGQHSLECRTPRHDTYQETVTIKAGELSSRNIVLQKLAGRLSLSTIDGAEVFLDGAFIGVTPLAGPLELEAGLHQLTVKKAGYHVWNNSIAIDVKQILPLKITLSPIY